MKIKKHILILNLFVITTFYFNSLFSQTYNAQPNKEFLFINYVNTQDTGSYTVVFNSSTDYNYTNNSIGNINADFIFKIDNSNVVFTNYSFNEFNKNPTAIRTLRIELVGNSTIKFKNCDFNNNMIQIVYFNSLLNSLEIDACDFKNDINKSKYKTFSGYFYNFQQLRIEGNNTSSNIIIDGVKILNNTFEVDDSIPSGSSGSFAFDTGLPNLHHIYIKRGTNKVYFTNITFQNNNFISKGDETKNFDMQGIIFENDNIGCKYRDGNDYYTDNFNLKILNNTFETNSIKPGMAIMIQGPYKNVFIENNKIYKYGRYKFDYSTKYLWFNGAIVLYGARSSDYSDDIKKVNIKNNYIETVSGGINGNFDDANIENNEVIMLDETNYVNEYYSNTGSNIIKDSKRNGILISSGDTGDESRQISNISILNNKILCSGKEYSLGIYLKPSKDVKVLYNYIYCPKSYGILYYSHPINEKYQYLGKFQIENNLIDYSNQDKDDLEDEPSCIYFLRRNENAYDKNKTKEKLSIKNNIIIRKDTNIKCCKFITNEKHPNSYYRIFNNKYGSHLLDNDFTGNGIHDIFLFDRINYGNSKSRGEIYDFLNSTFTQRVYEDIFNKDAEVYPLGDLNGDNKADILCYDRVNGIFDFYTTSFSGSSGNFIKIRTVSPVRKTFEVYGIGDYDGENGNEILLYDRNNYGKSSARVEIYKCGPTSSNTMLFQQFFYSDNFRKTYEVFPMGDADGDGKSEIFLYDRYNFGASKARAEIIEHTNYHNFSQKWTNSNIRKCWEVIPIGDIDNDNRTEIFLYDRVNSKISHPSLSTDGSSARIEILGYNSTNTVFSQKYYSDGHRQTWDIYCLNDKGSNGKNEALLYDRLNSEAGIFRHTGSGYIFNNLFDFSDESEIYPIGDANNDNGSDILLYDYDVTTAISRMKIYSYTDGTNNITQKWRKDGGIRSTWEIYPNQGYSKALTNINGNIIYKGKSKKSLLNGSISFDLLDNYPNPFNPTTTIEYTLKEKIQVEISIYNLLGQKIKTLVNEVKSPGKHFVTWNGKDNLDNSVTSGLYIYKMKVGDFIHSKKMLLIK